MTFRRHVTAPFAALALVFGCSGGEPPKPAAAADSTYISEQVFTVGYGRIADAYLQPVDMRRLGVGGLKGLAAIDPAITVETTGKTVRVYVSDKLVTQYGTPPAHDAAAWAALTAHAVEKVRLHSAPLRTSTTDRVYQAVFDAVTADLDGYSRYAAPQRATTERAQREGYGGIGLSLESQAGRHTIRNVLARGPAERAGVRDGDLLIAIDGETTAAMTDTAVRDRLRGAAGSLVLLTVGRDGMPPRRLPIRRDRIVPNMVSHSFSDGIALFRLERFNATTAANLREAVLAVRRAPTPARGLVLDLRGNPGGLLDQAVAVADLFIRRGRIIATEGRHPDSRQRFDAATDDVADGLPVVVLIDGRTASSAEVVAAALQDSGRAVVVGTSSYGKGSVQTVTRLPNDAELFLTWSRIYTPAGYTLHKQGVHPTICTSVNAPDAVSVLAELRDGHLRPAPQIASWRAAAADNDAAVLRLRDTCPAREHEAGLDVQVAKQLLAEPSLYRQALAFASTAVAER
ncbi:MAG TPA: S41 family peptidase [Azospirillum sp.]|nr:S41 family peptidase [Azospirillum sp.]